ncbi:MAG: hypothetical protein LBU27_09985 [Candidatus Peribacteria bacterium]|nr:hypothetical protein [Candidatus Peribacteria bacterium]
MATVKKSQVDALMLGLSDEERQNALNKMQNSQNAVVADYAKNYNLQNSTASKALGEQTKVDLSNLVKGGASGKEYEYDAAS